MQLNSTTIRYTMLMADPVWNEKKQRWFLRIYEGTKCVKTFSSTKPGRAGAIAVNKKRSDYLRKSTANPNVQVCDAWEYFMKTEIDPRWSMSAKSNLITDANTTILPAIGKRRLRDIKLNDLKQILNEARKSDGTFYSEKSMKNLRYTLTKFFRFCIDTYPDMELPDPSKLTIPKNYVKPEADKVVLNDKQFLDLFDNTKSYANLWYIHFFRFLASTGCRPGEAIALTYEDYDNVTGFVRINKSINVRGELTPGKTKNSKREFCLNNLARTAIEDQIKKCKKFGTKPEHIFCQPDGSTIAETTCLKRWRYLVDESRLNAPGTNLYSLRHTFISKMGVTLSLPILKNIVGHSVSMDTYKQYFHPDSDMMADAAEAMNLKIQKMKSKT